MDAKKLLKKHLDLNTPKGTYLSSKQLQQSYNDAVIGAINEALAIVPEPVIVLQENMERESLLTEIKRILNKVGNFDMSHDAINGENSIIVSQIGDTTCEIFSFNDGNVDCDIYVGDIETDNVNYLYEELSDDVLTEILFLAEIVEVDQDKTDKRIS
jgi:hypothetical protein